MENSCSTAIENATAQERLQIAVRAAGIGIWDWDVVKNELVWDGSMYQLYGLRQEDFGGAYEAWTKALHPDDRAKAEGAIQAALSGEQEYAVEFRIVCPDGAVRHILAAGQTFRDAGGKPLRMVGTNLDITERKFIELIEYMRRYILEKIASPDPIQTVLGEIALLIEGETNGSLCSILLLSPDEQHLLNGAAPSLPGFYNDAIHGVAIGDGVGSCGTAAATRKRVIVSDINTHPYWAPFKALALKAGLQSCWSEPIITANGRLLGTFAIYHHSPRTPSPYNLRLIEFAAETTAIAIEHKNTEQEIQHQIAELERFNRIASQREQRIVELKNVVNTLSSQLNIPSLYSIALSGDTALERRRTELSRRSATDPLLSDILDKDLMQQLFDSYCDAIGIASAIIDLKGQVFIGARWQRLCTDFHRVNPISCARCIESDTVLATQLNQGEDFTCYQCRNGLTDAASPIIINGRHVANVFIGQFFTTPPNLKFFRNQARELGFEESEYLGAISEVPIIAENRLPAILGFMRICADTVAKMGAERLALHQNAGELVQQRQAALSLAEDATEARLKAENAEEELRIHRDHLEELVDDRTIELQTARNEAENANRAKSAFLSNMSHELRTPINAILGFSQIMAKEAGVTPSQKEHLAIILKSGEHLLTLINSVLDLAKIEAGKVKIELEEFDLADLILDLITMLGGRAEAKGLKLFLDQSSSFPRFIKSDPAKLRQILINLVGNAIKFTRKGTVNVKLAVIAMNHGGNKLELSFDIIDTGPGMAQVDIDRLFRPFEQAKQKNLTEGTGLGLAIAREYITMMGGTISATSELGRGSTFHFTIQGEAVDAAHIPEFHQVLDNIVAIDKAHDFKILVVEDQLENRLLLGRLLAPYGFQYREAVNGEEGVAITRQWRPHVILMDRRMPVMGGIEATITIRKLDLTPRPVIIAVTAHAYKEEQVEMFEAGCDDFLGKPFKDYDLFNYLAKHLPITLVRATLQTNSSADADSADLPSTLATLPAAILDKIREAAIRCDLDQITDLLAPYPAPHTALKPLLDTFRFDSVIDEIDDLPQKAATRN